MTPSVTPLKPQFGAKITGVDISTSLDAAIFEKIRACSPLALPSSILPRNEAAVIPEIDRWTGLPNFQEFPAPNTKTSRNLSKTRQNSKSEKKIPALKT